jgi:CBS domain-containing protein
MEAIAVFDFLSKVSPFSLLDDDILKDIACRVQIQKIPIDRFVFRQGEPSLECLFIVVEGLVEILITSEHGVESAVRYRKPGDFFSETVVLSGQRYPGSARAKEPLVCIRVERALLEELIRTHPEFSAFFSTLLAERMRLLYESIQAEQSEIFPGTYTLPLFNKKVGEIMSHPVNSCKMNDQVSDVTRSMAGKGKSSAVVMDDNGRPAGILTEKDIVYHLVNRRSYPVEACRAHQIMSVDFETLPPEAFVGQALVALTRQRHKFLLVVQDSKLTGILSTTDIIKSRNTGNLTLLRDIRSHKDIESLAKTSREVDSVLNGLMMEGARTEELLEIMSGLLDRLTRAVIRLSEKKMQSRGLGPPPVDYCWINMGSAARHEQTLRTDQDNGIIYADPDPADPDACDNVQSYFFTLAGLIAEGLEACGFALCSGNVMASNPKWCRSLGQWKHCIKKWGDSSDPEDIRAMTIFLDFRPVWGNQALAESLWETIFKVLDRTQTATQLLTNDDLNHEKPIGLLGNVRTEKSGPYKDQFNLKTHGLVHLINGMRIYAMNHEIREPSTLGRLKRLTDKEVFSSDTADLLKTGFETLMMFKIQANVEKLASGKVPDNYIQPSTMSRKQRNLLKDSLLAVVQMQKMISSDFSSAWSNFFS